MNKHACIHIPQPHVHPDGIHSAPDTPTLIQPAPQIKMYNQKYWKQEESQATCNCNE